MNQPIKMIEATCPNCQTEMEVELPDGLVYQDPRFDEEKWAKLNGLTTIVHKNRAIVTELIYIQSELTKHWGSKRAKRLLVERLDKLEKEGNEVDQERYSLYNELNPPVGERSTD